MVLLLPLPLHLRPPSIAGRRAGPGLPKRGRPEARPARLGPLDVRPDALDPLVARPATLGPLDARPDAQGLLVACPAVLDPLAARPARLSPLVAYPATLGSLDARPDALGSLYARPAILGPLEAGPVSVPVRNPLEPRPKQNHGQLLLRPAV